MASVAEPEAIEKVRVLSLFPVAWAEAGEPKSAAKHQQVDLPSLSPRRQSASSTQSP